MPRPPPSVSSALDLRDSTATNHRLCLAEASRRSPSRSMMRSSTALSILATMRRIWITSRRSLIVITPIALLPSMPRPRSATPVVPSSLLIAHLALLSTFLLPMRISTPRSTMNTSQTFPTTSVLSSSQSSVSISPSGMVTGVPTSPSMRSMAPLAMSSRSTTVLW